MDHQQHFQNLDEENKATIDQIIGACLSEVRAAWEAGDISVSDQVFAEIAINNLSIGKHILEDLLAEARGYDVGFAQNIRSTVAHIMAGLYAAGGLVITSDTSSSKIKNRFRSEHIRKANLRLREINAPALDIGNEAIRYALKQPLSHPLKKRKGPDAYAERIVDAANRWLAHRGSEISLTRDAIAKRLRKTPGEFPPSDEWSQ